MTSAGEYVPLLNSGNGCSVAESHKLRNRNRSLSKVDFLAAKSVIYLLCAASTVCYSACQVTNQSCDCAAKKTSRISARVDDRLLPQRGTAYRHHRACGGRSSLFRFSFASASSKRQSAIGA